MSSIAMRLVSLTLIAAFGISGCAKVPSSSVVAMPQTEVRTATNEKYSGKEISQEEMSKYPDAVYLNQKIDPSILGGSSRSLQSLDEANQEPNSEMLEGT